MGGGGIDDLDCVSRTLLNTVTGAGLGAVIGSIELAWKNPPSYVNKVIPARDLIAVVTQRSGAIAILGATYTSAECLTNGFLGEKTWQGTMAGTMASGALVGLARKSPLAGFSFGLFSGLALCIIDYNEGLFSNKTEEQRKQMRAFADM